MTNEFENGYATRLARVEQRVYDLDNRVSQLVPVQTSVIRLEGKVDALRSDVARATAEQFERDQTRMKWRFLIITVSVTLFAALIGAITIIVNTAVK